MPDYNDHNQMFCVGRMCKLNAKMTAELYKEILKDELRGTIEDLKQDPEEVIFQHDNDPKHTSRLVQDWLQKQSFEVLDWPSQSPDMNPNEHLWSNIIIQLNTYELPPKAYSAVGAYTVYMEMIPAEVCQNLIDSMPRRIEAVIKSKGKWTKY